MKLRIAHVVHSLEMGGLERIAASLSTRLSARGHRVWIFCLRDTGILAAELPSDVTVVPVKAKSNDVNLPIRLFRMFRELRLDVVHTHNWNAWPDALLAAKTAGCGMTIQTFHGFIEKMPFRRRLAAWFMSRVTDHLTVVSNDLAAQASAFCGLPTNRFAVIHNGVDCTHFRPVEKGMPFDDDEKRHVTFWCTVVASLTPAKDPMNMLRALSLLPKEVGLVWVGDGPLAGEVLQAAGNLGLDHRIVWAGKQADVRPWLAGSDVVVSSSKSEAFPLNVLEAMAMRKPVVATNAGGTCEAITTGQNGIIVQSQKPRELAQAIELLIKDAPLRTRLAENARQDVARSFDSEAMVDQYESLYLDRLTGAATCAKVASA